MKVEFSCFYRGSTAQPHSIEKSLKLEVPMASGDVPEIEIPRKSEKADMGSFQVMITPSINSFYVDVFQTKKNRHILRQLYQVGPNLKDQFAGSHGFTGLVYVYHPENESELQFYGKVIK